jgi:ABC-type glycerol-3-phosphate transport system permease component
MKPRTSLQFEATLGWAHVIQFLLALINAFAVAFFWFLWVMTLYWLVFFKLQVRHVASLVPLSHVGSDADCRLCSTAIESAVIH